MTDLPHKNQDVHVVDTQLTGNPKTTSWFTDYQEVLSRFPEQTLMGYVNYFNRFVHDPVTAEQSFYYNLNGKEDASVELSSVDNTNIDLAVYDKEEYWEADGNKLSAVKSSVHKAPITDPVESASLADVLDMDIQFVLYWVEEFRTVHETVKEELWSRLPKEKEGGAYNTENVYFNDFNESLFLLKDPEYIKDRTSLTPLDIYNMFEKGNPNVYNNVQRARLDADTFQVADELSNKTSALFKKNIFTQTTAVDRDSKHIKWDIIDPSLNTHGKPTGITTSDPYLDSKQALSQGNHTSHGHNLAADIHHDTRIDQNLLEVETIAEEILGHMKKVLEFLDKTRVNDTQHWGRFNFKVLVENIFTAVDQSKSILQNIFENDPLSVTKNDDLR